MHFFEKFLSVSPENIEFELRGHTAIEWLDFLLNPRRLRGSDFLMRWSQGVWSEERIIISLDKAQELIKQGLILPTEQVFQAPGGATTRKVIYKIYYHYAYPLGEATQEPELKAKFVVDKNGHILPYVHFEGGQMHLQAEALAILREIANVRN